MSVCSLFCFVLFFFVILLLNWLVIILMRLLFYICLFLLFYRFVVLLFLMLMMIMLFCLFYWFICYWLLVLFTFVLCLMVSDKLFNRMLITLRIYRVYLICVVWCDVMCYQCVDLDFVGISPKFCRIWYAWFTLICVPCCHKCN